MEFNVDMIQKASECESVLELLGGFFMRLNEEQTTWTDKLEKATENNVKINTPQYKAKLQVKELMALQADTIKADIEPGVKPHAAKKKPRPQKELYSGMTIVKLEFKCNCIDAKVNIILYIYQKVKKKIKILNMHQTPW